MAERRLVHGIIEGLETRDDMAEYCVVTGQRWEWQWIRQMR